MLLTVQSIQVKNINTVTRKVCHLKCKCRSSCFKLTDHTHWKTGQTIWSRGSYEQAFISWCNTNQVDFDWQIPIKTPLLTPSGRLSTYIIDAFIKSGEFENTWIEIKGWVGANFGVGKRKLEWFHETFENSELWTKERLQKLKIL